MNCPVCGVDAGFAGNCPLCGERLTQVNVRRTLMWTAVLAEYLLLAIVILRQ